MEFKDTSPDLPDPLSGKFKNSFAYNTIKDRLPVILTKVIDCLCRDRQLKSAIDKNADEENKQIIGLLAQLRNEMVTNKPITRLRSTSSDVALWNEYLEKQHQLYGFPPSWFDSPWLYTECYLYRRIREAFEMSTLWHSYDPFSHQKKSAFMSSIPAAQSLGMLTLDAMKKMKEENNTPDLMYTHFVQFVEMSLWGNRCDLSISAGEDNAATENSSQLDSLRNKILVNDTEILWNFLQSAKQRNPEKITVSLVLDNAGFELFTDLCLLQFLHAAKLIKNVHLYVKAMPWYVSDTMTSDIDWLLQVLSIHEDESFVILGASWRNKIERGQWLIVKEDFWTLPHDYSEMKEVDEALYNRLSESDLIVFKGDLNYRKLTSDRKWDAETPFVRSLRGFLPAPLCALRTIKADVVTGLESGIKEELDRRNSSWMIKGEYAVIQCASPTL